MIDATSNLAVDTSALATDAYHLTAPDFVMEEALQHKLSLAKYGPPTILRNKPVALLSPQAGK